MAENNEERSFRAAFHQDTPVGEVYKEFISDEPTRTSSSRRWRSSEEFLTTAEFERHDRRIAKFRDRNWGKVFTLRVIKAPKVDLYGHGTRAEYQKNWDLGLTYQNELRASMKNLAYAMRRDERAHQHNLLRWMICGSTPSDISDAFIGAINSLMCVSFIMRRLQPLVGERRATDQSYTVYFRQDKSELKDLYREIEVARNFLWCIDMIYKSALPAMNINSISLAPHAADRAAENQDRRRWVSWLKEIEKKAEKDNVIDFDQNTYCTVNEADRELERYAEDFAIGEEPTWRVMGSSKTEPPQKTERQQKSASSSGQRKQTSGGPVPQQGASSGGSYASDAVKIDNEIIDSIFRMNSGGDDDRWTIINPTAGLDTYTSFEGGITLSGATVSVKFNIDANTGYPIIQTVFGPCLADGKNATYWECMLRCLTSSLVHFEEKTSAEKIILSYVRKGNAAWLQLYAFMCAQTGCLITGRLPGAKAVNALIQAQKNPDNAPGRLIRIIKEQKRGPIGGATIRDMMIQKKSFLVLDWPLRVVNAKGSTKTFQMMVNEQGWTNIEERSYYGSSEQVSSSADTMSIISRLQKLEKLIVERRRRDMDDSPVSVHIWMSLYDWVCMRGCGWQVTANPIIDSLQKTISDLVNTCKGLVVVCVNRDVAFHGGRGDLGTIANKVSEICKAAGALVTENDRLWRVAHRSQVRTTRSLGARICNISS